MTTRTDADLAIEGFLFAAIGDGPLLAAALSGSWYPDQTLALELTSDVTPVRIRETLRLDLKATKAFARVFGDRRPALVDDASIERLVEYPVPAGGSMPSGTDRYRVIYTRHRPNWSYVWGSCPDQNTAERTAAAIACVPDVIGTAVYDTHERTRIAEYGEPPAD